MSTSRFSRCATESKIRAAISPSASSRKSIARYAASSQNPAQPAIATRSATHRVAASLLPGSSARCATSANSTRSVASASRRRSAATRCSAAPTPSRSQSRSSSHAPPKRRESTISISPACAAAIACCGSRNRADRGHQPGQRVAVHGVGAAEVVDHPRRGHPGDRVAFAVRQLQIRHRRPVPVAPLRLPQVHPYTISTYSLVKSSDTPEIVCLHEFADSMTLQASYQHNRSALPRNVPTNCGSRACAHTGNQDQNRTRRGVDNSFSALLVRLLAPPSFGLFDGVDGEGFELGGQLAEAAGVVEPVPVTVELLGG